MHLAATLTNIIQSLRGRIVLSAFAIFLVALTVLVAVATIRQTQLAETQADDRLQAAARTEVANIRADLDRAIGMAETLGQSLSSTLAAGETDHAILTAMVQDFMDGRPQFLGSGLAFIDEESGAPAELIAEGPFADASGRLSTYVYRGSDGTLSTALLDFGPESGAEAWFDNPVNENRTVLTTPFTYSVDGEDVLMTTIATPIRDTGGDAIGIVAVDIALETLHEQISATRPMGTGYSILASDTYEWVSHPDPGMIGTLSEDPIIRTIIDQALESGGWTGHRQFSGSDMLVAAQPVDFDGVEARWVAAVMVPHATVVGSALDIRNTLIGLAIILILIGLGLFWFLGWTIGKPISRLTSTMTALADGDLSVTVPEIGRKDEIGSMARAVGVFKSHAEDRLALTQREEQAREDAKRVQSETIERLADDIDASVRGAITHVNDASRHLSGSASSLGSLSQAVAGEAQTAVQASDAASSAIATVSGAVTELEASIRDIGGQMGESVTIAQDAVKQADEAVGRVRGLQEASERIGNVVGLIQDIAEQTNLLALNATIEAARAGDAGKGFAIVAAEVKNLASQTAKATEEISGEIEAIRSATGRTVSDVGEIAEVIRRIDTIASAVSAAVTQQGSATGEIGRSMDEANTSADRGSTATRSVAEQSETMNGVAGELSTLANTLETEASTLSQTVDSVVQRLKSSAGAAA
ncbi:methyl-accepting chemotaxis protein [Fodinicurvata sp. EGI_FJ10296]|uniref:methyl-accepting chemotaxis protein n=1 Tax=Fodinicurvata sp. EGI_FJ10296 TaxID=3231908 RepID=UPI003455B8B2